MRFDHNLLASIQAGELASCSTTLTHLDLGFNQLTSVEGVEVLSSLTELDLQNNCLKEVPTLSHCKKVGCPREHDS